jgi:hypothetical protein
MRALRVLANMLVVDVRFGAREVAGRFAAALLLLAVFVTLFKFLTLQGDGSFLNLSFVDCFAGLFGGMSEYDPQHDSNFNVPAAWLCVCLMGAFVVLSYPARNLQSIGVKQCVAAGGRWCWWASKCIWTVACAFAYWLLAVAVAALASGQVPAGEGLTLSRITPDVLGFFAASDCAAFGDTGELTGFVVCVPLALSALYLVQLAVSVNASPLVAFAVTASVLFYGAFYLHPLSLGNYLMLARSDLVINNGMNAACGAVLSAAVALVAALVGGALFARHDLLGKEKCDR